ncbi:molybdate ABC transporter substrate-binding protein [Clostridium taeniosporum]|uniref:Molybdate ABC transporter substrate-binding protein n=1 Tax=Clostridium taeniosporum TaxID=394958 RepID=A0A1D7XNQ1_9CLOT|nr:molybdate ABC transporter substrate-binding protein [Clostridium taeniosporum]AOR24759.1 molybdate ABC transporter substrate-binding protein [Clostridium taeniosporum]
MNKIVGKNSIKNIGIFIILSVILFSLNGCGAQKPKEKSVTVFAAASLTECFNEIGKEIKKDENIDVVFNFAGSQALVTSIEQGSKADVFASANIKYMDKLTKEDYVSDSVKFAANNLILCKNKKSSVVVDKFEDLSKPEIKIIAGDKSVPVGNYFHKALDNQLAEKNINEDTYKNIINNIRSQELDVKSVVSKVALGEGDIGIVYRTDVNENNKENLDIIELKEFEDLKVQYPIAKIKSSDNENANEFIKYLTSDKGKEILKKHGFKA